MSTLEFLNPLLEHRLLNAEHALPAARLRRPALSAQESVAGIIRTLRSPGLGDYAIKAAVTEALLLEAQGGVEAMWVVLIQGYLPLLRALHRIWTKRVKDSEALWPLLFEAFVEAVAAYPGPRIEAKPCRYLRRATERRFVCDTRHLRRDEGRISLVEVEELDGEAGELWEGRQRSTREPQRFRADLADCAPELGAMLRELVRDQVPAHHLALVEATVLGNEDLVDYADRCFRGRREQDRRRTYCRLQQQRFRTLKTLRRLLRPWRAEVLGEVSA